MFYTNTLLTLSGLLALTLASPAPEPQSPAETTAYLSAISSYANAEATNPAFLKVIEGIATNPAGVSEIQGWETSIESLALAGETAGPSFINGLPTQAVSIVEVILSAEASLASKYGFSTGATGLSTVEEITTLITTGATAPATTTPASTGSVGAPSSSSSSGSAAAATGKAVGVAAAGLVGLVGVVMAL